MPDSVLAHCCPVNRQAKRPDSTKIVTIGFSITY